MMQGCSENLEESMEVSESKPPEESSVSLINCIGNHIFEQPFELQPSTSSASSKSFKFNWKRICERVEIEASQYKPKTVWDPFGRIGPASVQFSKNYVGNLDFKENPLEICSGDNFSTIHANTCVSKGKWQFELMLGSKGVMQVGWATLDCKFSQENGVGDTPDSYAYDGNRQRKWNVATHKYGEMWHCGDLISCTIDMNKGEISYLRNGRFLGVAFDNVKMGPGIAYFPALSLAINESLIVNFGATPFHYPQPGFQPLECPPTRNLIIANYCVSWLLRLVDISINWNEYKDLVTIEEETKQSRNVALLIIAQKIGYFLAPLLSAPYIIEASLITVLNDFAMTIHDDPDHATANLRRAHTFFEILMAILQEGEQKVMMNNLIMCLQSHHRQVAQTIDYLSQKHSLRLLHLILSHPQLRKFCLKYVLFESESHFRFCSFVCIKCIDKERLKNLANFDYWSSKNGEFSSGNREAYIQAVNSIETSAHELEDLQVKVLKLMLTSNDGSSYNDSSRAIFLSKFRTFLKDHLISSRVSASAFMPLPVILSLFHRCLLLFLQLWEEEVVEELGEKTIRPSLFYDGILLYYEIHRLGGLESHLKKNFAVEREQALKEVGEKNAVLNPIEANQPSSGIVDVNMDSSLPSTSGAVLGESLLTGMEDVRVEMERVNVTGLDVDKSSKKESREVLKNSLLQLLDGIIILYHHGGHKQVEKIVAQSDVLFDNVSYLEELVKKKEKYVKQHPSSHSVLDELDRSIVVLQVKLKEQSYQHAWNLATTLSLTTTMRLQLLLKLILGALKGASKEGPLFAFVPDFYVETLTELCQDLRHLVLCNNESDRTAAVQPRKLYQPGGIEIPVNVSEDYRKLLMDVGEFLSIHFCDSRIVYADSKDSLIQALAGFVCHKPALEALENMPEKSRLQMVQSLLQPYENRAWAQNNWILVRFWKGKGYGFRFTKSPHLSNKLGPKPAHCEISNIILSSVPYSSDIFLQHVSNCLQNPDVSTPFLNSLLNQLNWVFSEFIGMLQEIQNASNRPERVFIDSRQLRICATCFDLALALLRVLEMIVSIAPNIFLDSSRPNSQSLLTRLCQLLCQVLNRVSICSGCFSHVVNLEIPGLETIHYFPILTAVAGILCQLLKDDIYNKNVEDKPKHSATKTLLGEASFQMSSLYPLLGGKEAFKPWDNVSGATCSASSAATVDFCASLPMNEEPIANSCENVNQYFVSPVCECKFPRFCLRKYPADILNYEIQKMVDVMFHLEKTSSIHDKLVNNEDSDSFCTICYASTVNAVFTPCGHTSCITCITHYLMNRTACFFCKTQIVSVKDDTGKVIYTSLRDEDSKS